MSKYKKHAELLQVAPVFRGSFLAGGAITSIFSGKPVNDYDVYFKDESSLVDAIHECYGAGMWCACVTDRAITFLDNGVPVQLMTFEYFPTPQDIFDRFDFTCCMGAWGPDAGDFTLHDDFLLSLSERALRFNHGTLYPIASQLRVLKYQDRGFAIDRREVLKLALACSAVKMESWDDMRQQIGGAYGNKITMVEDGEFSISAACDAISSTIFTEMADAEEMPADADALIEHLGLTSDPTQPTAAE